jgi:hypothetical protein
MAVKMSVVLRFVISCDLSGCPLFGGNYIIHLRRCAVIKRKSMAKCVPCNEEHGWKLSNFFINH